MGHIADKLYPEELSSVCLMHFLRPWTFDRHEIFSDGAEFNAFVKLK